MTKFNIKGWQDKHGIKSNGLLDSNIKELKQIT